MTLDETVLQRIADWRPQAGRESVTVTEEQSGWSATIVADRNDELGSALWEMTLSRTRVAPADDLPALENWARTIVERATGLLEPLCVVEIDQQAREALLRSLRPTQRGDKQHYYELLLKGTRQAAVRRYRAAKQTEPREQVVFSLTHEALAKVIADIVAE
jgi:hypothetical protein